jgi:hypothetical protein
MTLEIAQPGYNLFTFCHGNTLTVLQNQQAQKGDFLWLSLQEIYFIIVLMTKIIIFSIHLQKFVWLLSILFDAFMDGKKFVHPICIVSTLSSHSYIFINRKLHANSIDYLQNGYELRNTFFIHVLKYLANEVEDTFLM